MGAVATALFVVLTLASIAVLAATGFPGETASLPRADATLQYIGSNRTAFIVDEILFQVPYMLTLVTFMALYAALKHLDKTSAAIGAALAIGSIVASLSYLTVSFGLVYLSDQSAAASTGAQQASLTSATDALLALYNTPSLTAILWPAGVLVISIATLKGVFNRAVAVLGIVVGIAGMIGEAAHPVLGNLYGIYGTLLLVWIVAVTWKLFRLGWPRGTT